MKISDKFKDLIEEDALVIVTGKQDAVFYRIKDGTMERVDAFKIPKPRYSDNEGHFAVRGGGQTFATGGMRELRDEPIIREFTQELQERLKKMPDDFKKLFLFVPSQNQNDIKKALPKSISSKLAKEVHGNYYYRSPQYLLEKLENED